MDSASTQWMQPRDKRNISTLIVESITEQLLSGHLRPGDKLPTEAQLSEHLKIGRNSIREAIKMLSSLGVVEIRRGSGTFITDKPSLPTLNPLILSLALSQRTSAELVELRQILDHGLAEIACRKIDDDTLNRLREINDQIRAESESVQPDTDRIYDLDLQFHVAMIEVTGNALISKLGRTIYTLFFSSMKQGINADPSRPYLDHERLIAALETRNAEKVRWVIDEALHGWEMIVARDK